MSRPKTGAAKVQKTASIAVRVIPRAKRNEIVGLLEDGTLKVRLTAPPVDGKANRALLKFLSDAFGIQKSDIEILSGETSRTKLIRLAGVTKKELLLKIAKQLGAKH